MMILGSKYCARMLVGAIAAALLAFAPVAVGTFAPAQAQVSVSAEFRTALEPYGRWVTHTRWHEVWVPNVSRDWRPYTVGRWVHTEDWGWYWVSDRSEADWGWITFHYGRWVFDREFGWVWVPAREWGPAWVQWRRGSTHIGWAALPPEEIIVEYRDEPDVWIFVRNRDFVAPRIVNVIVPVREQTVLIRETVVVNRTVIVSDRAQFAVNPGIAPAIVAAAAGRPLRNFVVQPRVLAGTAQIPGAVEVRAQDVRQGQRQRVQETVRETQSTIRPAAQVPPPQPLAAGERGRLGDNPPRAARGAADRAPTTGQAPPAGQAPSTGQAPQQQQPPATQGRAAPKQDQRQQQQSQPPPAAEGRGAPKQQAPDLHRAAPKQPQAPTEGRGAPKQTQPTPPTEGRGVPKQQRQPTPPTEGRGAPKQQAPDIRAAPKQPQPPATEGRSAPRQQIEQQRQRIEPQHQPQPRREAPAAQPQRPQGTEGRGAAPQPPRPQGADRGPPPQQQQQRPQQAPATEGRGGPKQPPGQQKRD